MTYTAKTNWTAVDGVSAADLNRIEQGIADITTSALPATSYTAADILTKIKTVDGSGSGLDADTVRGKTVLPLDGSSTMTGNIKIQNTQPGIQFVDNDDLSQQSKIVSDGAYFYAQRLNSSGAWVRDLYKINMDTGDFYLAQGDIVYRGEIMPQIRFNSGTFEANDSGTWKAVGGVKNVQRGVASGPNDGSSSTYNVTISTVNLSKSFLTFSAVFPSGTTAAGVRVRLTSSTNIEVYSNGNNGAIVAYEVVESY